MTYDVDIEEFLDEAIFYDIDNFNESMKEVEEDLFFSNDTMLIDFFVGG